MQSRALLAVAVATVLAWPSRTTACPGGHDQIFGVPIWATDPNEGNTWGAMPILIGVCPDHQTRWILAPSVTWNSFIHLTGTVRWYQYPDRDTSLFVIGSLSTRTNYRLVAGLERLVPGTGEWTDEATLRIERTIFARFFGLGPNTRARDESSYTLARVMASERRGLNLGGNINVGLALGIEHDGVQDTGVPDLPLAPEVFPDAPGMHGASVLWQTIDARYDDRVGGSFADEGLRVDLWGGVVEGLSGTGTYLRGGAEASELWSETDWLSGAARFYWSAVSSSEVPFYQQSELGGAFLMRGFADGRFVDRQAWTVELEQRIRLLRTDLFGVQTDWRVDPFVATGQVFGPWSEAVSKPQFSVGAGLRAFVRPKVVGRVDVATGGEGLKVYVEIGYPY